MYPRWMLCNFFTLFPFCWSEHDVGPSLDFFPGLRKAVPIPILCRLLCCTAVLLSSTTHSNNWVSSTSLPFYRTFLTHEAGLAHCLEIMIIYSPSLRTKHNPRKVCHLTAGAISPICPAPIESRAEVWRKDPAGSSHRQRICPTPTLFVASRHPISRAGSMRTSMRPQRPRGLIPLFSARTQKSDWPARPVLSAALGPSLTLSGSKVVAKRVLPNTHLGSTGSANLQLSVLRPVRLQHPDWTRCGKVCLMSIPDGTLQSFRLASAGLQYCERDLAGRERLASEHRTYEGWFVLRPIWRPMDNEHIEEWEAPSRWRP